MCVPIYQIFPAESLYAGNAITIGLIGRLFERDSPGCESALISGIDVPTINVQR
jgi:hypothetical protein